MRPSRTGIVKDGTSSAELRGSTGPPNDAGFLLAISIRTSDITNQPSGIQFFRCKILMVVHLAFLGTLVLSLGILMTMDLRYSCDSFFANSVPQNDLPLTVF